MPTRRPTLSAWDEDRLIDLTSLAARGRSGVERDPRTREIDLVHDAEAPNRLVQVLSGLLGGLQVIGVSPEAAWSVNLKVGLDCMPVLRRSVLEVLANAPRRLDLAAISSAVGHPKQTTRRAARDLAAHGLVPGGPPRRHRRVSILLEAGGGTPPPPTTPSPIRPVGWTGDLPKAARCSLRNWTAALIM